MKLPSLQLISQQAVAAFKRFPLAIISAFITVACGIYWIETQDSLKNFLPLLNVILTGALGIPLFFCASIAVQDKKHQLIANGVSILILIGLYFSLPNIDITHNTSVPYIRYGIFNMIIHLVVSFIPYLKSGSINGFWNYNKALFLRFLMSILYSGFLFGGICLGLAAINLLFNADIEGELIGQIFVTIGGIFNTWFFVAGVPRNFEKLDTNTEYPKGLKIFTQFVLIPLLVAYLVILYVYIAKVLIGWDWPKGIVAYLIAYISVLGIFTLLLIHPYGKLANNKWITQLSKIYYWLLFPLAAVLFIAVYLRINAYGLTINRYALVVLGIWLIFIAGYFALGKTNIKVVPISLAGFLIAVSFGPWSMFSVGERSQLNRLNTILNEYQLVENGKIKNETIWITDSLPKLHSINYYENDEILSDSINNQVKSILDYLDDHHGFDGINNLFAQNMDSIIHAAATENRYFNEASIYMQTMGLKYLYRNNYKNNYHSYYTADKDIVSVKGYDYLHSISLYSKINGYYVGNITIDSTVYSMYSYQNNENTLALKTGKDSIGISLTDVFSKLELNYGHNNSEISSSDAIVRFNSEQHEFKLLMESIAFRKEGGEFSMSRLKGNILIRPKQKSPDLE